MIKLFDAAEEVLVEKLCENDLLLSRLFNYWKINDHNGADKFIKTADETLNAMSEFLAKENKVINVEKFNELADALKTGTALAKELQNIQKKQETLILGAATKKKKEKKENPAEEGPPFVDSGISQVDRWAMQAKEDS